MALTFKTKRCSRALLPLFIKSKCSDTKSSDDSTDEVHNLDTNAYDAIKVIGHGSFVCLPCKSVRDRADGSDKKSASKSQVQEQRASYYESISSRATHPFIIHLMHY